MLYSKILPINIVDHYIALFSIYIMGNIGVHMT